MIGVACVSLFALYAGGGIAILAQGLGATWASISDQFHTYLHLQALGSGWVARGAERMSDAAHDLPTLGGVGIDYGFSLFNLALAGIILWLRPRDATARLLAVGLVGTAGVFNLTAQQTFEVIPLTAFESVTQSAAHIAAGVAYAYALLLFPDGRPVPRWRPPALVALYLPATIGAMILALRVEGTARPAVLIAFFGLAIPTAGVAAQAYKFRIAKTPTERAQARLLFWALLPALGVGAYFLFSQGFASITEPALAGRHLPEQPVAVFRIFQPVFALIPLVLGVGLLRYRLWDIQRVLNRTVVYGLLTAIFAAAYFVFVVVFQQIFAPFTGGSTLAVAVSTLAVAAAFNPVRRRLQDFLDKLFYRHRYDANQAISAFTARVRSQVDRDTVASDLQRVVNETLGPRHVSLLLRSRERHMIGSPGDIQAVEISHDDPVLGYFQSAESAVEIDTIGLESIGLAHLRESGTTLAVPFVSHGELIGLLSLSSRLSDQRYSSDDRSFLEKLAAQAAPVFKVAQLLHEQEAEIRGRERYQQELQIARLIQENFLPKSAPDIAGWQLTAHNISAREVSGDFHDLFTLPDGRIGIVIGDVTDKGVPAALVMASTRAVLRGEALRGASPGEVLEKANDVLCPDMPPRMFCTCLYAILNPTNGHVIFANAGHNLPYRRGTDCVDELRARGMPLGLMEGMLYEESDVTIGAGEVVLFTTDGIAEAHNESGEMFGCPRIVDVVARHRPGVDLRDILLSDLDQFTGDEWEQEDDITIVILERTVHEGSDFDLGNTELASFGVASDRGNERAVMDRVAQAVAELGLPAARLERLKTAVSEAAMNAIEHGNEFRSDLEVKVTVMASADEVRVKLVDHGGAKQVPETTAPDIDLKLAGEQTPRGWGLFLIRSMIDEMIVSSDGVYHTLELVMARSPQEAK